jgi:hypothetical protein
LEVLTVVPSSLTAVHVEADEQDNPAPEDIPKGKGWFVQVEPSAVSMIADCWPPVTPAA